MRCNLIDVRRTPLALAAVLFLAGCGRQSEPRAARNPAPPRPHEVAGPSGTPRGGGVSGTATGAVETAGIGGLPAFQPASVTPGRPTTLREAYPGYHPGADDPEFDSIARGRRLVPVHDRTFESGGAASLQDLVELVVAGIDQADSGLLDRASINLADFRSILWPEFPQSRPAAGVPVGEAWDFLHNRNGAAFNRTAGEFKGQGLQVRSIRVGKVVEYTNFRLHDDITVTVAGPDGQVGVFPMIRTVAECRGRFKLYSTRD